jgi:glycosyltransferase involved in cell wall biosynthesis
MKICHLSISDLKGGAAIAAYRLCSGLRDAGIDSSMYVRHPTEQSPNWTGRYNPDKSLLPTLRRAIRGWKIGFEQKGFAFPLAMEAFSGPETRFAGQLFDTLPDHDVLHLHWVSGLVDLRALSHWRSTPLVWTLHDMNLFTGGCHYDLGCDRYRTGCGACPHAGSTDKSDPTRIYWQRKRDWLSRFDRQRTYLVTPSQWLANTVRKAPLTSHLLVKVIPNGVPIELFKPRDKQLAREILGIPQDAQVVACVANDLTVKRKGIAEFIAAIKGLAKQPAPLVLPIGQGATKEYPIAHVKIRGYTSEPSLLSLLYSAADFLVLPSLQDNFPNVALEAMACGLPIVAFAAGGIPEMIDDGKTGLLAPVGDLQALTQAMEQLLANRDERAAMGHEAVSRVRRHYTIAQQAESYLQLYRELLAQRIAN